MNILISGENLTNYYAKVHEAFRTGLRICFGAKMWGKGYPGYDEEIRSYKDIKEILFGNDKLDLLILHDEWDVKNNRMEYSDIELLDCKKAVILGDFWSEAESDRDSYFDFIRSNHIDYILSYFRKPFQLWAGTDIGRKLIWLPPCFDPVIFNDWNLEKKWDVANLNAGIFEYTSFYPERYEMHQKLCQMSDVSYCYTKHPGGGFNYDEKLIGHNFSEIINRCKIFVTSGNLQYKNFNAKYVESMASGACLFATPCLDDNIIGLVDGYNYVKITSDNLIDKVRYYLKHDNERELIAKNGFFLVMKEYTCFSSAAKVIKQIVEKSYYSGYTW